MKRKRHSPEQIICKLKTAELGLSLLLQHYLRSAAAGVGAQPLRATSQCRRRSLARSG